MLSRGQRSGWQLRAGPQLWFAVHVVLKVGSEFSWQALWQTGRTGAAGCPKQACNKTWLHMLWHEARLKPAGMGYCAGAQDFVIGVTRMPQHRDVDDMQGATSLC